jgi:5-methylcytosine-specific restriction endonuclease McrA
MPNFTPSTAKNHMRRTLAALLDPHPKAPDVVSLWTHFKSSCAYCGCGLSRSRREGHRDHLVSHAEGGGNSIYNCVLACARCNGNEKRETEWKAFLRGKAKSSDLYKQRKAVIDAWRRKGMRATALPTSQRAKAQKIISAALKDFDVAVESIRALRGGAI